MTTDEADPRTAPGDAPFPDAQLRELVDQFHRDGYVLVRNVLAASELDALSDAMERKVADPRMQEGQPGEHIRGISLHRMFEYAECFRDLIVREPLVGLAEAILGDDCHVIAQNALRYLPGQGGGWHVDDFVHFPLPDHQPGFASDFNVPCFIANAMVPLTAAGGVGNGVTEIVPGSHRSGRRPPAEQEQPTYEGRGPVPILTEPGDLYLFHNQTWHRGTRNESDTVRLVATVAYGRRFIAQRFFPFIDYRMPSHVWQGASPRLQRLLGRHQRGAYG